MRCGEDADCNRAPPALAIPEPGGFWFFAYGSLMWDAPFEPAEALPARIFGWHRSFCVSSETYRGTPEKPGLSLGLEKGGSCAGLALRVDAENRERAIDAISRREMEDDPIYVCRRTILHLPGRRVAGHTLVVDRNDRIFAGGLTFDETARRIAAGAGQRGSNIDYLADTVAQLERMGIDAGGLRPLLRRALEFEAPEVSFGGKTHKMRTADGNVQGTP